MKLKYTLMSAVIVLVACVIACEANTLKPFVRSRYSLRWRRTTETPKILDTITTTTTTTTAPKLESATTLQAITYSETSQNAVQETTVPAMLKTSTHSPDYDYYGNNELEENEHKIIH